ncbi:DUF924 family protein [Dyella sp. S184]|uniref:DUF924 family protein n=1 Tax=Dyella sp. S184 TaxID=1641862 RepID=UPI00131D7DAF|nr:DUF924 family protein [Dyella sp. S184]
MSAAGDVLDFWFAEANAARWFVTDAAFDEEIREHFGHSVDAAADGRLDGWTETPSGWLALLILLDQFPRNLYRGDSRAWAQDVKAQRVVLSGISRGDDRRLPPLQRVFAYMPLEHAENMDLQQLAVERFGALCLEALQGQRERFEGFFEYARRHREVIARFGRFPHRNAALGRASTPEELLYLAQPGAGF